MLCCGDGVSLFTYGKSVAQPPADATAWVLSSREALALTTLSARPFRESRYFAQVEPLAVGICRSDLKEYLGARPGRSIFGHEIVGRISAISEVPGIRVGDLVVHNPNVEIVRSSGFATRFYCGASSSEALCQALISVPATIQPAMLTFVEPLAVAFNCLRRIENVQPIGERLIIGSGFFGILIGLLLRARNNGVTIANRSSPRLEFAQTAALFDPRRVLSFDELSGYYDTVIIATTMIDHNLLHAGYQWPRCGGLLHVFAGTAKGELRTNCGVDVDSIRRRQLQVATSYNGKSLTMTGSHGCDSADFAEAIEFLGRAESCRQLARLIGGFISFDDLGNFMAAAVRKAPLGRFIMVHDQKMTGRGINHDRAD